jgi:3-oxoacyl-[acyl-carrier-protein] synthase III
MRSGRCSTVADEEQTVVVKDFVVNRHGRLVFPSNAWPRLDFSAFDTVGQLSAAVSRDFEAKAPSASQNVSRLEAGASASPPPSYSCT